MVRKQQARDQCFRSAPAADVKKDLPSLSDPSRNFQSEKRFKSVKFVQYHRGSGFY